MSGKLDQSLDEIMKDSNTTRGPRRGRNGRLPGRKAATKAKAATTALIAPAGGVQKKTKAARPAKGPATAVVPQTSGESKISVSNLPEDVNEHLIKDFFSSSVAPVKKVLLNYGPQGRSRGSATVLFNRPTAAAEAVKYDGTKVDGRSMRIEVLMGAKSIPAPKPPKSLAERVQPKNAVKEDQKKKQKEAPGKKAAANGAAKEARPKKAGRAGRPKKKTAEELDAEMQDYFGSGEAPAANGAPVANGGDTGMEEVI